MLNAKGEIIELETLSDVVKLLKSKEARDSGVDEHVFHRNGMASIEAVATGLRARGYEVQGFHKDGLKHIRLLSLPGTAAKRRKEEQGQLFALPAKKSHYGDAA
jgi:hypothetical protein